MTTQPTTGTCARCGQTRPVFTPPAGWGKVPSPLCSPHWQQVAEARANGTYLDWNDAFDNATDEELALGLAGEARQ